MASEMLRIAGRGIDGTAKALLTTNEGALKTNIIGSNTELIEGKTDEYLEINSSSEKAIMIAIKGSGDGGDSKLSFQHYVDGFGWMEWLDGEGNIVSVDIKDNINAVLGPFQGFPLFDKGRLIFYSERSDPDRNAAFNQKYSASVGNDIAYLAFNENHSESGGASQQAWHVNDITELDFPFWLTVELDYPQSINKLQVWGRSGLSSVKDFILQGSNDSDDWTDLMSATLLNNNTQQTWEFENQVKYKYYRYFIVNSYGADILRVHDVRLFNTNVGTILFDVKIQGVL